MTLVRLVLLAALFGYVAGAFNEMRLLAKPVDSTREHFLVGEWFTVEDLESTVVSWDLTKAPMCAFVDGTTAASNPATLSCSTSDLVTIGTDNGTVSDSILVGIFTKGGRFRWQVHLDPAPLVVSNHGAFIRSNESYTLSFWMADPSASDMPAGEFTVMHETLSPLASAKALTLSQYSIGMRPVVSIPSYRSIVPFSDVAFNVTSGVWSLSFHVPHGMFMELHLDSGAFSDLNVAIEELALHVAALPWEYSGSVPASLAPDVFTLSEDADATAADVSTLTHVPVLGQPQARVLVGSSPFTHFGVCMSGVPSLYDVRHVATSALHPVTGSASPASLSHLAFARGSIVVREAGTGLVFVSTTGSSPFSVLANDSSAVFAFTSGMPEPPAAMSSMYMPTLLQEAEESETGAAVLVVSGSGRKLSLFAHHHFAAADAARASASAYDGLASQVPSLSVEYLSDAAVSEVHLVVPMTVSSVASTIVFTATDASCNVGVIEMDPLASSPVDTATPKSLSYVQVDAALCAETHSVAASSSGGSLTVIAGGQKVLVTAGTFADEVELVDPTGALTSLAVGDNWADVARIADALIALVSSTGRLFALMIGDERAYEVSATFSQLKATETVLLHHTPLFPARFGEAQLFDHANGLLAASAPTSFFATMDIVAGVATGVVPPCPIDSFDAEAPSVLWADKSDDPLAFSYGVLRANCEGYVSLEPRSLRSGVTLLVGADSATVERSMQETRSYCSSHMNFSIGLGSVPKFAPSVLARPYDGALSCVGSVGLLGSFSHNMPVEPLTVTRLSPYGVVEGHELSSVVVDKHISASVSPVASAAQVAFGCPVGRHIRVAEISTNPEDCPKYASKLTECTNYTIGEACTANTESTATYSFPRFGCPLAVYQGTSGFKPTLELWDGATKVKTFNNSAFVIHQFDTNRGHITYSKSESAACSCRPQSWAQMAEANPSVPRYEAWTRDNYQPCGAMNASACARARSSAVYEVLGTSDNAIVFPAEVEDGLFLLRVRVIDGEASFCDLSVDIALDVFGSPVQPVMAISIILGSALVVTIILGISFLFYRRGRVGVSKV